MTVINEVFEVKSELERENNQLTNENNRLKSVLDQIIQKTHLYEGSDPLVWDIEIIATKAVLNQ